MHEKDKFWKWYTEYLKSEKWKAKKESFLKFLRDRGYEVACVRCGKKTKLVFHHIHYDNVGDETINDVLLFCHGCHNYWHKLEKRFTPDQKFNKDEELADFVYQHKWAKKAVKYTDI